MLSEHEVVVAIRDNVYPKIMELGDYVMSIYEKGMDNGPVIYLSSASSEIDKTINRLKVMTDSITKLKEKYSL